MSEASGAPEEAEIKAVSEQQNVEIVRSVRFGRLMLVGAFAGAVIAALAAFVTPLPEGALYTSGQIVGFMAVLGAALGLLLGAVLGLLLNLSARKKRGSGVAVHTTTHADGVSADEV